MGRSTAKSAARAGVAKKSPAASHPKPRAAKKLKPRPVSDTQDPPEHIVEIKRKMHREIFNKCLEKKMLQEMDIWDH